MCSLEMGPRGWAIRQLPRFHLSEGPGCPSYPGRTWSSLQGSVPAARLTGRDARMRRAFRPLPLPTGGQATEKHPPPVGRCCRAAARAAWAPRGVEQRHTATVATLLGCGVSQVGRGQWVLPPLPAARGLQRRTAHAVQCLDVRRPPDRPSATPEGPREGAAHPDRRPSGTAMCNPFHPMAHVNYKPSAAHQKHLYFLLI